MGGGAEQGGEHDERSHGAVDASAPGGRRPVTATQTAGPGDGDRAADAPDEARVPASRSAAGDRVPGRDPWVTSANAGPAARSRVRGSGTGEGMAPGARGAAGSRGQPTSALEGRSEGSARRQGSRHWSARAASPRRAG